MESVNIPADSVPEGLKACEQILKRGKELRKAEPVVAYWCCFSAAQTALKVPNRSREGTAFLMSLLDALEQMKDVLATNEAVTNEAAGSAFIENFALKVFMSADNDDRAGNTGKATIRKFVVAGQFIDVLRCFENGMTEEMEQKLQYARWKAADLAKALREGRTPVPGPPMPEEEISPFPTLPTGSPGQPITQTLPSSPARGSFSSATKPTISQTPGTSSARGSFSSSTRPPVPQNTGTSSARGSFSSTARPTVPPNNGSPNSNPTPIVSPRPSPLHTPRSNLPGLDTTSTPKDPRTTSRTNSQGSGLWSTVATPGIPDDGQEKDFTFAQAQQLPSTATSSTLTTSPPQPKSPGLEKKNVRFSGPDGAPLSPAGTYISVESFDSTDAPPPTVQNSSPTKTRGPSPPPVDSRPRGNSNSSTSTPSTKLSPTSTLNSNTSNTAPPPTRTAPANTARSVPPPPPPSLAAYPTPPTLDARSNGLGLVNAPPPPQYQAQPKVPTRKEIETTQKHARWAISALEFDDVDTAKLELRKALAMLGG